MEDSTSFVQARLKTLPYRAIRPRPREIISVRNHTSSTSCKRSTTKARSSNPLSKAPITNQHECLPSPNRPNLQVPQPTSSNIRLSAPTLFALLPKDHLLHGHGMQDRPNQNDVARRYPVLEHCQFSKNMSKSASRAGSWDAVLLQGKVCCYRRQPPFLFLMNSCCYKYAIRKQKAQTDPLHHFHGHVSVQQVFTLVPLACPVDWSS